MGRIIAFLVGALFVTVLFVALIQPRDEAVETVHGEHAEQFAWSWAGPAGLGVLGKFDNQQLQRGFQVYKEVCQACHGLTLVAFRDLQAIGFSEPEVKAIAKEYQIASIDQATGEPATRPGLPADRFPPAFPNEVAARAANNNAVPPDLSLIAKAREGGSDYLHSLLGYGYDEKARPKGFETPEGLYFNKYFPNLNLAMPPPLIQDEQITYTDGTKATVQQMSADVTAFLTWTAEPKMMERRQMGVGVVIFLSILLVFAFLTFKRVSADVKGKPLDPRPQPAE